MKKISLLVSLSVASVLFFDPATAFCQEKHQAACHFMLLFPQGEFRQNVENTGLGANLSYAYRFSRSLFSVGISLGFSIYGHEKRVVPLSPTIPDITVGVTTNNSIVLCHLVFRFQPQKGKFRTYVDGLVGVSYLTTDTSIEGLDSDLYDHGISSNNYDDVAFSYGVGVGAMISLGPSTDLDVGVRYIRGGKAEYLKEGSIHREYGSVTYDVYRSRTDLLGAYIGLSFSF